MAGGQERILRGRIKSMQATKKITRAMELIAGSRIVKAQQRVQAAVPYSEQITEVVKDLAAAGGSSDSPLLLGRDEIRTTCYVVISADRGLCGGYNAGVQRAATEQVDVTSGGEVLLTIPKAEANPLAKPVPPMPGRTPAPAAPQEAEWGVAHEQRSPKGDKSSPA